ncbi:oxidoreductase YjhC domain protein, partial [Candidatus Erwinia dacicola]
MIGTGHIGRCHAIAHLQAPTVFNLRGELVREILSEVNPELAAAQAATLGFSRSTGELAVESVK